MSFRTTSWAKCQEGFDPLMRGLVGLMKIRWPPKPECGEIVRWLDFEQTLNDRAFRERVDTLIDLGGHTVKATYRPEARLAWSPEVVVLPINLTRRYGPVAEMLELAFGARFSPKQAPLFVHPQSPAVHRRLRQTYGSMVLETVRVTPTSSYRSVLAWRDEFPPVILKLSLGAIIGGVRRVLHEKEVASAVLISRVLDTISSHDRERLGLHWFPEPAGVVESETGSGWLLRQFPAMAMPSGGALVPAFSLTSAREQRSPLLVEMIERSGLDAQTFLFEKLLGPYVRALAFLLFEEGIQVEGHPQNVLFEIDGNEELTGRVVLRDLSDMTLSLPMRIARGKPLPIPDTAQFPDLPPFPLATVAGDHRCQPIRSRVLRGRDTVERYGLGAFVGSITDSLRRSKANIDPEKVERRYLELWQQEAIRHLGIRPLIGDQPKNLATDEAMAWFLQHTDWNSVGSMTQSCLPPNAEALLVDRRIRNRRGAKYARLESPWGGLFLTGGLPAFFSPAF